MQFWYLRRTSPPPWLPPFTQMRIRNKHTANMEEHQGAGFPGLVQHGYPTWTSKLGGTEWMRVWPLLLCTVPQLQKGPDVKGKGAFRELTVCKTHYAPSAASRGRKGPPTGKILVQWPKHSLPPQGHSLFKGERELAFKGPERSAGQRNRYKTITVWIWMPQCLGICGSPSGDAYLAFLASNFQNLVKWLVTLKAPWLCFIFFVHQLP